MVTGESTDVVVSLSQDKVISSRTLDPLTDGQLPILDQDFALAEEIVHADPGLARRDGPPGADRRHRRSGPAR